MAYVYFHPSSQFRPLRNAGAALNQTSMAAGISTQSQLVPAKSATTPNETNRIDQPIDFLEFALISFYSALLARLEVAAFLVSPTLPHRNRRLYPYIFSWSRWKPMRATPRQIMVKAASTSQCVALDS
jgi:hypothetical protein